MKNKKLVVKSILRILGIIMLVVSPFFLAFFINNNHELISHPKEDGFFYYVRIFLDLYVGILLFISYISGLLFWSIGIINNNAIGLFEKKLNKVLWFLTIGVIVFLLLFIIKW